MQTIDSYVIYSTTAPWRPRRKRAQLVAILLTTVIAVAAGFAFLSRAGEPLTMASNPKSDARVVAESSTSQRSDDEARIAAFQQAAAISHLTLAASATSGDAAPATGPATKSTDRLPRKPTQKPAPKSVMLAPPVPQSRPATPEVIMADLPPTPQADPPPAEDNPPLLGRIVQNVEGVPNEVQDFARGMTDRMLSALSNVRARVGL